MLTQWSDPIVAIATAPGRGAIGVVRLSGLDLRPWLEGLLGNVPVARHATYGPVRDAEGNVIDHVIAIFFPKPHSYTGEDVLELQAHGGDAVLQLLLKRCLTLVTNSPADGSAATLRIAKPGEFTERAYRNQKMDLLQAEAVADLIDASTELAVRSAARSLQGGFSIHVQSLLAALVKLRMLVEATLDFPEEDIDFLQKADANGQMEVLLEQLQQLELRAQQGALLRDGIRLVIAGQPNVGKSSLLNALAGMELAIVTPVAGTTRDVVTQAISMEGVPVHVVDTAGLRDPQEPGVDAVERIGMERAWAQIRQAHVLLFLHDQERSQDVAYLNKDAQLMRELQVQLSAQTPCLHVWNKSDLCAQSGLAEQTAAAISISARTGHGLPLLRQQVLASAGRSTATAEGDFSARERHLQALRQVNQHMVRAQIEMAHLPPDLVLVAEELRLAQQQLSNITGEFTNEDLLGEIFSRFCIGK